MSGHLQTVRGATHLELVLSRPECRNALSRALIDDLTVALRRVEEDDAVRSVIVTGAPPAFCAGLDLREVAEGGERFDNSPLLALLEMIERLPQPVIAAVNGAAMAGGAALVTACDLAIGAESATFGYPGVKRGLVAPLVMTYLCRLVGERHARFLLLTGESVPARRACEMGLVNEVVPDAGLLERARQAAAQLAACPREAVAQTKALLRRLREPQTDEQAAGRLAASLTRIAPEQLESGVTNSVGP